MQSSNVIIMPKPNINQNPEGIAAIWRAVHKLEDDFKKIAPPETKIGVGKWIWSERAWFIPTAIIVLGSLLTGVWYVGGLILDRHLQNALAPIQQDFNGKIQSVQGSINILQGQIATFKYSAMAPAELKNHRNELASVKTVLSNTPRNIPNFWPTSFQIITLLSQANTELEAVAKQRVETLDGVHGKTGPIVRFGTRDKNVLLKNIIEDATFENSVIHLDPSVQLKNDTFINCVFIFPSIEEKPPNNIQQIGSELLAADLSKVTVKGS